jgi:hypothetical protein
LYIPLAPPGREKIGVVAAPPYNARGTNDNEEGRMIDSYTKQPIEVIGGKEPWPYVEVQLDQLDVVKKLLDDAGYRYSVDKYALSFNGGPYTLTVAMEHRADAAALQKLFDDNEAPKVSRPRRLRIGHPG